MRDVAEHVDPPRNLDLEKMILGKKGRRIARISVVAEGILSSELAVAVATAASAGYLALRVG